jgi:hypothetical protein
MAQGEYTSNIASGTMSGAATGAAMGSVVPGLGNVAGAIVGGLIGLGKSLTENKAAKERASKVAKQKSRLKKRRKQVESELSYIPSLLEQKRGMEEDVLEEQAESTLEDFIEQTVGNIKSLETVKGKTGLTSSSVDNQITSSEEKSSKVYAQVMDDLRKKKENLEYTTEAEKASRIQGLIGDLYSLDTTIEGL